MKKLINFSFLIAIIFLFNLNSFAQDTNKWTLSSSGMGPVKIGMSLKQAAEITKKNFTDTKPDPTYEDESCFYTKFKDKTLDGILFMVSNGKIVRIDITSNFFTTSTGARIGDTEESIKKSYRGKIKVEPHHYNTNGHYLTYREGNRAIRFETDGKKVTSMYAGRIPEIQYVEGCA